MQYFFLFQQNKCLLGLLSEGEAFPEAREGEPHQLVLGVDHNVIIHAWEQGRLELLTFRGYVIEPDYQEPWPCAWIGG